MGVLACVGLASCGPHFTAANVDEAEREIASEYSRRGFTPSEVELVQVDKRRLSGFARVTKVDPLIGRIDATLTCEAQMGTEGKRYTWICR